MDYRCAHRWAFPKWGAALQEMADELAAPSGHEVTVRVTHCGMCHSDLHVQAGGFDMGGGKMSSLERAGTQLPVTMGHEIGGEVVEIGPEVHGRQARRQGHRLPLAGLRQLPGVRARRRPPVPARVAQHGHPAARRLCRPGARAA